MDRLNDVGTREDQIVVAPFQRLSAEILGAEVVRRRRSALDAEGPADKGILGFVGSS